MAFINLGSDEELEVFKEPGGKYIIRKRQTGMGCGGCLVILSLIILVLVRMCENGIEKLQSTSDTKKDKTEVIKNK